MTDLPPNQFIVGYEAVGDVPFRFRYISGFDPRAQGVDAFEYTNRLDHASRFPTEEAAQAAADATNKYFIRTSTGMSVGGQPPDEVWSLAAHVAMLKLTGVTE